MIHDFGTGKNQKSERVGKVWSLVLGAWPLATCPSKIGHWASSPIGYHSWTREQKKANTSHVVRLVDAWKTTSWSGCFVAALLLVKQSPC